MSDLANLLVRSWALLTGGEIKMTEEQRALRALEEKLRAILPPEYASYEDVQPVSMGTAGLKYDAEGKVAWDEIWGSFCDLAMAGGPPHKGKLLEPATAAEVAAEPVKYRGVVEEICRGIRMVSYDVAVEGSDDAGWVRVMCPNKLMAGWIGRAIVMENVSARVRGEVVEVPAGPGFRLPKEIKNVVTVIAKTCHYYDGHMSFEQQKKMGMIFAEMEAARPLLQPVHVGDGVDVGVVAEWKARVGERLGLMGLGVGGAEYVGWFGIEVGSVKKAIWMMRALVVGNVMARREETVLYVPVNPGMDAKGEVVCAAVSEVKRLAAARGVI
ncbi:MAG: hypothetical protein JNK87_39500 [Bryobacterales bacterium]|nr:hypothetical protein [Bryobacterales bacterium]